MKNKRIKRLVIGIAVLAGAASAAALIALAVLQIRTKAILDDHSAVYENTKYQAPVMIEGADVITQDVSCGYAVIEMFSSWNGSRITEESLYDQYGKVVTSTGKAFCREMNKQFPEYTTTMYKYLKNSELIDQIYENLSDGIPVPIEWAALYGDEWTLHYSLVTGMDIPGDKITIVNPYGYYEEVSVAELLSRTSFEAYENMPLFLRLGFAFGIFEKNTIFRVR
ncbi:MAG: C39 family peptidase [Lachnospiraceae bacterium]|nr:C39 family peptidase [Lachnospiraceae bacterium]